MEQEIPIQVTGVLDRARSVRRGILACSSLPAAEAAAEMALVLTRGLRECARDLSLVEAPVYPYELVLLLTAERYWMEALLDLVDDLDVAAEHVVAAVLAALPEDD